MENVIKEIKVKHGENEYIFPIGAEAANVKEDANHIFMTEQWKQEVELKPGKNDPVSDNTVVFTSETQRKNIARGDSIKKNHGESIQMVCRPKRSSI